MPGIGQSSNKRTRFLLPNGFKKMLIRNEKDIELLLMNNRTYCAELSQALSAKKRYISQIVNLYRKLIVQRAKELNVRLTNATGKLRKTTAE